MHTPTPWAFKKGEDNTDGDLSLGSIMGDDMYIARVWNDHENCVYDAALIVKAVNSYEAMKKALLRCNVEIGHKMGSELADLVDNALALAEGKE